MLNAGLFLLLMAFVAIVAVWLRLFFIVDTRAFSGDWLVCSESSKFSVSFGAMMMKAVSLPFRAMGAPVSVESLGFPLMFLRAAASCVSARSRQRLCIGHRQLSW
jgi:hypothetical protein